jgi:hypothetical protein
MRRRGIAVSFNTSHISPEKSAMGICDRPILMTCLATALSDLEFRQVNLTFDPVILPNPLNALFAPTLKENDLLMKPVPRPLSTPVTEEETKTIMRNVLYNP